MTGIRWKIAALVCWGLLMLPIQQAKATGDALYLQDVSRVQRHLRVVEAALRGRKPHGLTPAQQAARVRALDNLRTYYKARVFPRNTHFPHRRVPYFCDDRGTLCAMAYLIARSGGGDLVARVARANNNAYIRELAADPELQRWLSTNGLTAKEAAWIQPTYNYDNNQRDYGAEQRSRNLIARSIYTTGFCLSSIDANLHNSRNHRDARLKGITGIALGLVTFGIGVSDLRGGGERVDFGRYNIGLGFVTTVFGIRTLRILSHKKKASQPPPAEEQTVQSRWDIEPFAAPHAARVQIAYRF